MPKDYEIEGIKLSKDAMASLKEWVEGGFTFWSIIGKMAEAERLRAVIPYDQSTPIELTKVMRDDASSKHWAFNSILDLVEEIREKK